MDRWPKNFKMIASDVNDNYNDNNDKKMNDDYLYDHPICHGQAAEDSRKRARTSRLAILEEIFHSKQSSHLTLKN